MEMKKGNSIIELTVVVGLISLLALAMSAIMLTTMTSSTRIKRLTKIKQSGDFALTQIQTLIRNAKDIVSCDSDENILSIRNSDGGVTEIALENDSGVGRIASNSGIYITPPDLSVSNFSLTCEPSITEPTLFKFAFDITDPNPNLKTSENSSIHFETTTAVRNE